MRVLHAKTLSAAAALLLVATFATPAFAGDDCYGGSCYGGSCYGGSCYGGSRYGGGRYGGLGYGRRGFGVTYLARDGSYRRRGYSPWSLRWSYGGVSRYDSHAWTRWGGWGTWCCGGVAYACGPVVDRIATWELTHPGESWDDAWPLDQPPPPPATPVELAALALREGRFSDAESRYRALAAANQSDAAAWLGVAHATAAQRRLDATVDALQRALRASKASISPTARFDAAAQYGDEKALRASRDGLRVRARWSPSNETMLVLAWFEAGAGEAEEARLDAEAVLRSQPDEALARALAGR